MKKTIITIASLVLVCITAIAQESVTPFIKELPQRNNFNPAFLSDNKAYFILPGIGGLGVDMENSGFCWEDLFTKSSADEYNIDLDKLAKNMRKLNLTSANVDIPLLAFGFRTNNDYAVSFGVSNKTRFDVVMPRSITDIRHGNYEFDNDRVVGHSISDVYIKGMNYMEAALGLSRKVNDFMRFGIRFKFLSGTFSVFSDDLRINVNTVNDNNRYHLDISTHGSIHASAPISIKVGEDGYVDNIDFEDIDNVKLMKNNGFAIDLGGTMKILGLTLGLSATDLGFIKWKNDTHQLEAGNSYTFRGVNVSDKLKDTEDKEEDKDSYWDQVLDSLKQFTDVSYKASAFKTRLSGRIMASAECDLKDWLSANALVRTKTVDGHFYTQVSAGVQLHAKKWLTWAISGTMNHSIQASLGTGLVLTGGAFQYYLMVDRIPFNIAKTHGAGFSTGINFVIGRKKIESGTRSGLSSEQRQQIMH